MINAATAGVDDHKAPRPKPMGRSMNLSNKAVPTDKHSTRTANIAALLVSVSFVNIPKTPSLAEEQARRSCLTTGVGWVASPSLEGGQVAVLRLHAASARSRNEGIILLFKVSVCAPWHKGSARTSENTPSTHSGE